MFQRYIDDLISLVIALRSKGVTKEQALEKIKKPLDTEIIRRINEDVVNKVYEMPRELIE
jgi:predicted urease superfamily metal-dependent hydrolase